MFEFYDDMTIDDALKFQNANYIVTNNAGGVYLNINRIEDCRKEMLDDITGGSKEQFDNILALGKPKLIYCPDGFIYTSYNGEDLVCVGAIAEAENVYSTSAMYTLVCIADEIDESAFAIDFDKPATVFDAITFPFLKPHCLPPHSLRGQEAIEIDADNITDEEFFDALSFVTTAEKLLLTVKEAHELFNLSEKSLYDFARKNPNSHVLLRRGKKILIKREKFKDLILSEAEWDYGN